MLVEWVINIQKSLSRMTGTLAQIVYVGREHNPPCLTPQYTKRFGTPREMHGVG